MTLRSWLSYVATGPISKGSNSLLALTEIVFAIAISLCQVSINLQFDSADSARNPVVARLAAINGQDLGDLGQTFIIAFNRGTCVAAQWGGDLVSHTSVLCSRG